jgi:hypothetical protein
VLSPKQAFAGDFSRVRALPATRDLQASSCPPLQNSPADGVTGVYSGPGPARNRRGQQQ